MIGILAGLILLHVGSTSPADGFRSGRPLLVAKAAKAKSSKRAAPSQIAAPVRVTSPSSKLELSEKKRRFNVYEVSPSAPLRLQLTGEGKLVLGVYQVVASKGGPSEIGIAVTLDGRADKPLVFKGKPSTAARLSGPSPTVSQKNEMTIKISAGTHELVLTATQASASAVVEIQYFAGRAKSPSPVVSAPAADLAAIPAPPPAPSPPPAPVAPPPVAPEPVLAVRAPAPDKPPAPSDPATAAVEARIRAGQARDAVVGSYPSLTLKRRDGGEPSSFYKVGVDKPFAFVADGPGVVTVRVHRLAAQQRPSAEPVQISILENDVLLQTVDISSSFAPEWVVSAGGSFPQVSAPKEYKLTLGGKLSRFAMHVSENAAPGVALRYAFAPQPKSDSKALALALGDELGLSGADGGTTLVTEVDIRETVVEKVVRVEGERAKEVLGVAVAASAVVPAWGGMPAPAVGLELRLTAPSLGGHVFALSVEGGAARQNLASRGVDPSQTVVASRSGIWLFPARVGPTYLIGVSDSVRIALGARGVLTYVQATSSAAGGERTASATALGAAGRVSLELRLGAGWWGIDAGYLWTQTATMSGVIRRFAPGGIELGTRFRFVL